MEEKIQKEILFYLSDKIRDIDRRTSLSEIKRGQRVLDLCGAIDEIEGFKKEKEEPVEKPFTFLTVD